MDLRATHVRAPLGASAALVMLSLLRPVVSESAKGEDLGTVHASSREGPFKRWLESLVLRVDIPPITGTFLDIKYRVDLEQLICKHLDVSALESKYDNTARSYTLGLGGISAECDVPHYDFSYGAIKFSGSTKVIVTKSSIDDTLVITGQGGMATQATNTKCNVDLHSQITFPGHPIESGLVELLSKALDGLLNEIVEKELTKLINTNLTQALQKLDHSIEPLLPPVCCPPVVQPQPLPNGVVDWNSSQLIHGADRILNRMIGSDGPLGLNPIVDRATDGTGTLDVPLHLNFSIDVPTLKGVTLSVGLRRVVLGGLDTFSNVTLLKPISSASLSSVVALQRLNFTVELVVHVQLPGGGGGGVVSGGNLTERFRLNAAVVAPRATLTFQLALYENQTRAIRLAQLSSLPCVSRAVYSANISALSFNFSTQELKLVALGGDLESDLDEAVNNLVALFVDGYKEVISGIVYGLLDKVVREKLNARISSELRKARTKACAAPAEPKEPYTDWTRGAALLDSINGLVSEHGILSLNWILHRLVNTSGDVITRRGELMRLVDSSRNATLRVMDLNVSNVASFLGHVALLEATDAQNLHSLFQWGRPNLPPTLSIGLDFDFGNDHAPLYLTDNFTLSLSIQRMRFGIGERLQIDKRSLGNLSLGSTAQPGCIASSVSAISLNNVSVAGDAFKVRVAGGRSTLFRRIEQELVSGKYDGFTAKVINYAFTLLAPILTQKVTALAEEKARDGPYVCRGETPPSSNSGPTRESWLDGKQAKLYGVAIGCTWVVLLTAMICLRRFKQRTKSTQDCSTQDCLVSKPENATEPLLHSRREESKRCDSLGGSAEDDAEGTDAASYSECAPGVPGGCLWDCLASSPKIPSVVRYLVPFILCLNVYCFIYANLHVGASVNAKIDAVGRTFTTPSLFEFTLANTIDDMWKAGVYPLSILVALFSGAWTYLKLMLMMICWLFPTRWLPPERRETLLMALDALGKWSLLDTFVLGLMLVAFRVTIANGGAEFPVRVFAIDILVTPGDGFYYFLLATVGSLLTTHLVVHYHRKAETRHNVWNVEGGNIEALCNHAYLIDLSNDDEPPKPRRVACSWLGKIVVTVLLVMTACIIVVGSVIESFKFEFKGLAALFLGDAAVRPFSWLDVIRAIPSSVSTPNALGIRWIQATFYVIAFYIPLVHLLAMMILWWTPLRLTPQYRLFYLTEILNAWSALDVGAVSLIAAVVEIQQFANFLVGDVCDGIDVFIRENMSGVMDGYDTCFTVIATLSSGCWALFAASLISLLVAQVVMRSCHATMHGRIAAEAPRRLSADGTHVAIGKTVESEAPKLAITVAASARSEPQLGKGGHGKRFTRFLIRIGLLDTVEESRVAIDAKETAAAVNII